MTAPQRRLQMTPEQRRARASIAARTRHRPDDADLDDDRREFRTDVLAEHIRAEVDRAPALNDEQRSRLARMLRPNGPGPAGGGEAA